jgi:hypothetical protein
VHAGEGSPGMGDERDGMDDEDVRTLLDMKEKLSDQQLEEDLRQWGQTPTGLPPSPSPPLPPRRTSCQFGAKTR